MQEIKDDDVLKQNFRFLDETIAPLFLEINKKNKGKGKKTFLKEPYQLYVITKAISSVRKAVFVQLGPG